MRRIAFVLVLSLLCPAPAAAFEEAMHLFLAHEAYRNLRIKPEGSLIRLPYRGWIQAEWTSLMLLALSLQQRGECADGPKGDLCRKVIRRIGQLEDLKKASADPPETSRLLLAQVVKPQRPSGGQITIPRSLDDLHGSFADFARDEIKRPIADLLIPFADRKGPFQQDTDGIVVATPFVNALSQLGEQEFLRHFLAGVLGPDSFPDMFTGPIVAHRDWSGASLDTRTSELSVRPGTSRKIPCLPEAEPKS